MAATVAPALAPDLEAALRRLKLAAVRRLAPELLMTAHTQRWAPDELMRTVLEAELAARDASNARARLRAAGLPVRKTLDEFAVAESSVPRATFDDLASLEWIRPKENLVLLGPAGTGKSHLSIALGVQAARRGYRVAFATARQWGTRLGTAKRAGRLDEELERLGRIPLLIVDEVGYIPFDPEAAALFFALISLRYERRSLIVSSNKTFSAWAEIFGDPVAVAAMVDRLVDHAEVIVLKGESYRLRGKREEVLTAEKDR